MNDWRAQLADLKRLVAEEEAKVDTTVEVTEEPKPKRVKRNRGRGALPLLRPEPKRYRVGVVVDSGPPVHNWRRSPMER